MSLVHRHCRAVASALLALAALGAAPCASSAQGAMGAEARALERRTVELRRLRTEQRRSVERGIAHAQMPDTMYASTPDPAPPPHAVPIEVKRPGAPERSASLVPAPSPGHRLPLLVSASGASGYEGVVRLINRSGVGGEVRIEGYDDAGVVHGPVALRMGAGEAVHFSAGELERGAGARGLEGRLGRGEGDWRLELTSALDLEVLGYVRGADGFWSAMHDVVPRGAGGQYRVVWFNPASETSQSSRLRLVNRWAQPTEVRIEGRDDAGAVSRGAVRVTVPARGARTLSARELESGGAGLAGALGVGTGRWRLVVSAERPIEVMSLVASAGGHLANVSTVPGPVGGADGAAPVHRVAWLPAAVRWTQAGYRGVVRIVNRTGEGGEVRIEAVDDAGVEAPAVTVVIGAHEAVELTSAELEGGSAEKGLSGGIGVGEGDWWLRLTTGLEVEVLAYVQAQDGFVSPVHDAVARSAGATHRVEVFTPASETSQASRLRLVNPGAQAAEVRIEGIDDAGVASPGALTFTLGGGSARTLGAVALESGEGEGLSGGLGDGEGRWRLLVSADSAIEVMSPLASPSGQVANLSTAPGATEPRESAAQVFAQHISEPVVQAKCVACHTADGVAGATRLHFEPATNPEHQALNLQVFEDFIAAVDDATNYILNKMQGVDHGGRVQVAAGTPEFTAMERFLALLGEGEVPVVAITPQTLFDTVTMAPARKTLRRAAIIFAGRNPTDEEYAAVAEGDEDALRTTLRGLMTGPQFREFLIRGANDRLLTDRTNNFGRVIDDARFVDYGNEKYCRWKEVSEGGSEKEYWRWWSSVQNGFRRAPLELIAHVVENDLPYTEILTADYIMANPLAAAAYGASTRFEDSDDPLEFRPSRIESYYRTGEGFEEFVNECDPVVGETRILDSGLLSTEYPHAGILNTTVYLRRYPTTATNRNRARSRWTYYHFLGLDIEKSASRTTDPEALADANNPTLLNPACTVCHRILDPVAGAFQNYDDVGLYKEADGGMDSLDGLYKNAAGPSRGIRATSGRDRETLSWPVSLAAGTQTLRVVFTNHFHESHTRTNGTVYLDRLTVIDADGRAILRREFEDLKVPIAPWGPCGRTSRSDGARGDDHLVMWNGYLECAFFVDIEVPSDGAYDVEIVAWADRYEQYGEDGLAKLGVTANLYREGDTWYRDMRVPGFNGEAAPNPDNSVQWLARKIVADERFAEATVRFWWPAIMGSEVAEPPEDEGDADFEGLLLAATAQGTEVERLAEGFRRGFEGGRAHNLKDLLVEIVLSKWFRADAVESANPILHVALQDTGARRLLTPEELARKTAALTGFQWGRGSGVDNILSDEYRTLYGGIDSDGITERARDLTSVMAGVAELHAAIVSCAVVARELYLLPDAKRRLFAGMDTMETGSVAIRNKLVELYDSLLGVRVTPHSPDVEAAYRLFVDTRERGRRTRDEWFDIWLCEWHGDAFFLEGILDEPDLYSDRAQNFINSIDWSDLRYAAQAWMVVLAYVMTDYRYLYL